MTLSCDNDIRVLLDNEKEKETIVLSDPRKLLIIESGVWREFCSEKVRSVLCMSASDYYDENDYIRDYQEYLEFIKKKEVQGERRVKMKRLIIIGTGETADIAYEYFTYDSEYEVVAFSVEKEYLNRDNYHNKPLVDLAELEKKYPPNEYKVFVALSSGKLNRNRTRLYNIVKKKGYICASYVSSKAFVWKTAEIGENCLVFENNVIQHGCKIGNNVILWSGNHIGHQTIVKDNCFISSHCVISGFCEIGESSFLGVNCTCADQVKIGKDCFIGAGALINRNLLEDSLVAVKGSEISKVGAKKLSKVKE